MFLNYAQDWGEALVVECFPNMHEALCSIPNTKNKKLIN
jgi:hypothetical protein